MYLRGGETYSEDDAAIYAAYILVHELGHQLFHFGHPFGAKACVMNPTPLLHFRDWVKGLSPRDCPIGSSNAMKPGAVNFALMKQNQ
ncbi:MAG TPA: hypothetical protein VN667_08155 [Burkholderiales bacterium]|nr:hypothetical protein [Burkholderiales bacterium]